MARHKDIQSVIYDLTDIQTQKECVDNYLTKYISDNGDDKKISDESVNDLIVLIDSLKWAVEDLIDDVRGR